MSGSPPPSPQASAAAAAAVRAQVLELGSPTGAREASRRLEHFQRAEGAVQICSVLLKEALLAQDTNLAFFAALTVAERARMPTAGDAPVAADLCSTLRAGALCQAHVPGVVVRQLASAHARLALSLGDEWPGAFDDALNLPCGPDAAPLTEVLRALAEEPLNRRCPVSPSQRARFVAAARDRTADVMRALSRAAEAQPSAKPLQAAAVWLRAQPAFEQALPMIAHRAGTHPSLCAFAPLLPLAVRAARLELNLEAFGAAAEVLDTILSLTNNLGDGGASEVVVPLLSAFGAAMAKLLPNLSSGAGEMRDVCAILISAVRSACTASAVMRCGTIWTEVMNMAFQLLSSTGLCTALTQQGDGSLLDSMLRTFEDTATAYNEAREQALEDGTQADFVQAEVAMSTSFGKLLDLLPGALALPAGLEKVPEEWELEELRRKGSRAILAWCGGGCGMQDAGVSAAAVLQRLEALLGKLPPPGQEVGQRWADIEVALWFATSTAQAVYRGSVRSDGAMLQPGLLLQLLASLPSLPRNGLSAARWALISASATQFACAADPWLNPELLPPSSDAVQALLAFLLDVASDPSSPSSACEALCVAIANLAPAFGSVPALGQKLLQRVAALILASGLPLARRERFVQSALGPLLELLPRAQLEAAFGEFLASMRASAAPPRGDVPAACPGPDAALLFRVLGAMQLPGSEDLQLRCFSDHWSWFESLLQKWVPSEAIANAACETLAEVLGRAWAHPGALEVVARAASQLGEAARRHRAAPALTVPALTALTSLIHQLRGAPGEDAVAAVLARTALETTVALLGSVTAESPLPADVAVALPELLAAPLAQGRSAAALCLLQQQQALSSALLSIAAMLPELTCPRAMCWSLRLCARLPHWLQQVHTSGHTAAVFQAALPYLAKAWCHLAASSPVAREPEVLKDLVGALREASRAAPEAVAMAVARVLAEGEIGSGTQEPLLMHISDASTTEESFAEVLMDSMEAWQTQGMRRQLCAH